MAPRVKRASPLLTTPAGVWYAPNEMKVLLTGGAGFIGSHAVESYLKAGYEVVVVDNLSSGKIENLPKAAKFYLLDLCSPQLDQVFELERPDIVNHHAAQISVTVSVANPQLDARVNALGLLNLLEASVRYRVRKLIFISSGGAIYGDTERMPTPEDAPTQPLSPYGIHKLLGEQYLGFFHRQYGLQYTALRYANVYGPRQNPEGEAGVVAIFIDQLLKGKTPTIYTYPQDRDGMTRDYVYVEDVARASLLASEKSAGGVFNIATGQPTTTGALYREIARQLGSSEEPGLGGARPGDLRLSCLDVRKAAQGLDWRPSVSLQEGIARTIRFFRNRHDLHES